MRTSKAVPVLLRRAPQGVGILVFTWSCPNSPDTLTFLNQVIGFNDIGI